MNILIIEDEIAGFKRLSRLVKEIDKESAVIGPATSIAEVVDALRSHHFDLIFSDIQLTDGTCFDAFAQEPTKSPIVFTTAYGDYALEAFRYNVVDYLPKPVEPQRLKQAIDKARKLNGSTADLASIVEKLNKDSFRHRLLIAKADGFVVKDTNDISHIQLDCGTIKAFLIDGSFEVLDTSLSKLIAELDPDKFMRVNRQYIVNIDNIERINSMKLMPTLQMRNYSDLKIPISRDNINQIKIRLDK